jgi:hypothetical protein
MGIQNDWMPDRLTTNEFRELPKIRDKRTAPKGCQGLATCIAR